MSEVILKLVVDEAVFPDLSDTLLLLEVVRSGFNSEAVCVYSHEHGFADIKEQVAGYHAKVEVGMLTTQTEYKIILQALQTAHPNIECSYYVLPVFESGRL